MTTTYTDADIVQKHHANQLYVTSADDYTINLTQQATVYISTSAPGSGQLSNFSDSVSSQGKGNVTLDLGDGNDTFWQKFGQGVLDLTGNTGNDTFINRGGAEANYNFNFNATISSPDGHDSISGFSLTRDTLTLKGTAGTVNANNFSTYFTVTDTSNGTIIADKQGDGWSVQLVGIHTDAATLLADHAILFA